MDQRKFRMKACWIVMSPELQNDLFFRLIPCTKKGPRFRGSIYATFITSFLAMEALLQFCVCAFTSKLPAAVRQSLAVINIHVSSPCSLAYLVVDFWESSFASILAADFSVRTVIKHLLKLLPCQVSTATGQCCQFCNVGGNKRHTWCAPTT
eukprot:COSAG01_NODE_4457_length_5005_cov_27.959234_2_plen_152_part_00